MISQGCSAGRQQTGAERMKQGSSFHQPHICVQMEDMPPVEGNGLSPGILPGLTVVIGLEAAAPVIGHSVAFLRNCFRCLLFQDTAESGRSGGLGVMSSGTAVFTSWPSYAGYHLNRIHFEIGLNSVCSFNPSLDAYFNSAVIFSLIISAYSLEKITDF